MASSVCAFAVSPAPATSFISPPLYRTSRQWRCVYSARQQKEPVRRLRKGLARFVVVLADEESDVQLEHDAIRCARSLVLKIVGAFVGCKCSEDFADRGADGFDGARGGRAQEVLDLGEDLLDRVQVWRVFGQEEELGAGGRSVGTRDLFDIGPEAPPVDGTVE